METVSYLTINDETKEIADITSRNSIENMAAVVAAHDDDIQYIQFETGPEGAFLTAVADTQTLAKAAQTSAEVASDAAARADEKAESAGQAADRAWDEAKSASIASNTAWNKAVSASISADVAEQKADEAIASAATAESAANSATQASELAWDKANEASTAADLANRKADEANVAAEAAQKDARDANKYANGALAGLSTLESVIDTVNWFAEHKSLSTDTQVDSDKNYYIYDSSTGTMSKVEPTGSENPTEEGWYEIDETIQNYVASHVAQTDDGLYVLSTGEGWRILISTGAGNYVPGVFIVDPTGVIKQALTGNGIRFDNTVPYSIGDDQAYIVFDGNGHITLGGDGVNILSGVTIGGSQKTLSQVLNDLDSAIISIEYGVGNSRTSHSDITNWSPASPQWESGKYVWMRTSNGTSYTYTCIQGAQGERGEQGPQGEPGAAGTTGIGVASVEISYAISNSGETIPDTWTSSINQWYSVKEFEELDPDEEPVETEPNEEPSETEPNEEPSETEPSEEPTQEEIILNIEPGTWLWVKTETFYTDNTSSVTYQKSYIGTDGKNGTSVYIQSVSKDNHITTVTLVDSDGNFETLEIADGKDGANGTPGANGKNIHIAWADTIIIDSNGNISATGFSTSNSNNKSYMGVYSSIDLQDSENPADYNWSQIKGPRGTDGKILNIHPGIYTLETLPSIGSIEDGDAYLVDDGDGQYDLYYKGSGATQWTVVENWQGVPGEAGPQGEAGPEAVVTVTPTAINWDAGTATLEAILRINGTVTTPTAYNWTKGTSITSLGTAATLDVTDLNSTYNCTVTW